MTVGQSLSELAKVIDMKLAQFFDDKGRYFEIEVFAEDASIISAGWQNEHLTLYFKTLTDDTLHIAFLEPYNPLITLMLLRL